MAVDAGKAVEAPRGRRGRCARGGQRECGIPGGRRKRRGRRWRAAVHACPAFVADARPVLASAAPVARARRVHIALLGALPGIYVSVAHLAAYAREAVGACCHSGVSVAIGACPAFVADARPVLASAAPVATARRVHIAVLGALPGIYVSVAYLAAYAREAVGARRHSGVRVAIGACPAFVADACPVLASAAPVAAARRVIIAVLGAPT